MRRLRLVGLALAGALALSAVLGGQGMARGPARPRILGISHVALKAMDLERSRAFYGVLLGLPAVPVEVVGEPRLIVTVNDRQYVELRPGVLMEDRLVQIGLETDDVEALRKFLGGRGVAVPARAEPNAHGDRAFTLPDPEGNGLAFSQRSRTARPATPAVREPVSRRILHAGVIVTDLPGANRFYGDLLGLHEIWRGSRSGTELSWTNMQLPDGTDYVEFMLYATRPSPDARGTQHHICLEVPDIEAARARLSERVAAASYTRPLEVRVGTNRKRQMNLYDPDGTRVELMEPVTVDGQPVPSSMAPPPGRP
jgi:catechol 2,3-dioxygenase-like lactoylglutathione lyase family enzyme